MSVLLALGSEIQSDLDNRLSTSGSAAEPMCAVTANEFFDFFEDYDKNLQNEVKIKQTLEDIIQFMSTPSAGYSSNSGNVVGVCAAYVVKFLASVMLLAVLLEHLPQGERFCYLERTIGKWIQDADSEDLSDLEEGLKDCEEDGVLLPCLICARLFTMYLDYLPENKQREYSQKLHFISKSIEPIEQSSSWIHLREDFCF